MKRKDKPLVWLHGEIKTPPMSSAARTEAGFLLRKLQNGGVALNASFTANAIIILEVFEKKTQKTPRDVIGNCKRRIRLYDTSAGGSV